jgi:hypothetical protein
MYFQIQKVIKIPSLEKKHENLNFNFFNEELSTYFRQLKLCMIKRNISYFFNNGHVYYKCYLAGCDKAYKNKKDLTVHLRKHVR